ncbi:MAG: pyridoxal phosphate-dependent aminotransferase [Desulfatiglandales bacterium]
MTVAKKIKTSIDMSSWIRAMFEEGLKRKVKYGVENVFDFSLGNPNLEPPEKLNEVLAALVAEKKAGIHGYMPNPGFIETRDAVAKYLRTFNQQDLTADEIVMTCGAGGALNVVFKTILDPGDEVIVPSPYFVEYNFYIDTYQGVPKVVKTHPDFGLDFQGIEAQISGKTKAVLINSPNNPTGRVYDKEEIDTLARLLTEQSAKVGHTIYLISDEPYRKIVYDDLEVPSIFNAYPESFMVTSFSKDLSLAGERIGYVAVHPELSEKDIILPGLVLCNRILGFVNAPAFFQRAIPYLLEESVDVSIYRRRRDMLYESLVSFGYEIVKPGGTFYLYPKTPIEDDVAFVKALQEENILTVPGSGFMGPGHFRIAYCADDKTIENSLPGFERVMKRYQ